jgi:hypothetical protein
MKFPFIILPRAVYDQMVRQADERDAANRRLTRTIVKMKVAGGSIPRATQGMRLQPAEPDPIDQAIAENKHAAARPAVRKALQDYADRERKKGTRPERILEAINKWSAPPAEDDEDDSDPNDDDTIALVVDDEETRRRGQRIA